MKLLDDLPGSARAIALALCLGSIVAFGHVAATSGQQPQSGIDPCSRALARMATPIALTPTDPAANRLAVSQTVMNFSSCFNRRYWDGVLALTSDGFRASMFGVTEDVALHNRLERLEERNLLPQMRIQSIEENGTTGSTLATLVVTWMGWSGLHQELWRLEVENGNWVLSGRSIQSPPVNGVAVGIRFELDQGAVQSPAESLANPGTVVFAFENRDDELAQVLVLNVEPNVTAADVIAVCNGSGAIKYSPVAALQITAGEIVSVPMFDLADGVYAIVAGNDPCTGGEAIDERQVILLDIIAA